MTEKFAVGGTDLRLRRREVEVVVSRLLEKTFDVEDVNSRIRMESNDTIEVGGHVG